MTCTKSFLQKRKFSRNHWGPLLKSSDPSWLGEYPLKTGVPPSFAFIKQRPVREGHMNDGAGHVICQNRAWHTVAIYDKYEIQVFFIYLMRCWNLFLASFSLTPKTATRKGYSVLLDTCLHCASLHVGIPNCILRSLTLLCLWSFSPPENAFSFGPQGSSQFFYEEVLLEKAGMSELLRFLGFWRESTLGG